MRYKLLILALTGAAGCQKSGSDSGVDLDTASLDEDDPAGDGGSPDSPSDDSGGASPTDSGGEDAELPRLSVGQQRLSESAVKIEGEAPHHRAGSQVVSAGDVDGDGLDDLLVAARGARRLYLVSGPASETETLAEAQASFHGGTTVGAAGDVNRDGYADVLIGDIRDGAGEAHLFLGPLSGTLSPEEAEASFVGTINEEMAGWSLDSAGDFNGDGYGDFLIGSRGSSKTAEASGAVRLLTGPVSGRMSLSNAAQTWSLETEQDTGFRAAGAGDVDGDGLDDVIIGNPLAGEGEAGSVWLVAGPGEIGENLFMADATLEGLDPGDGVGFDVDGAGDVNRDGYADLLIGASPAASRAKRDAAAYLVLGPVSGYDLLQNRAVARWTPYQEGDKAGSDVAGAGDVDQDGYDDLLIAAPRRSLTANESGAAYLILGDPELSGSYAVEEAADAIYAGEAAHDRAASSLDGGGDLNGDGFADILIGAYYNSGSTGESAGAAYIVPGGAR